MDDLRRKIRKNLLPLILAVLGFMMGGSEGWATLYANYDFSAGYTNGPLVSQKGWGQVPGSNTNGPILVTNSSVRLVGVATSMSAYNNFTNSTTSNAIPSTSNFFYALENFTVQKSHNVGQGVIALYSNTTGSGTNWARLFVRRAGGSTDTNITSYNLGISASGSTAAYGATAIAFSASSKLVVAYNQASNAVSVYVNPVGQEPANWGVPEVTQTVTTSLPLGGLKSFVLQQGQVSSLTVNQILIRQILVGDTTADVLPPPGAPTVSEAVGISTTGFIANWSTSTGATKYYLDVATDSGFTTYVAGFENLDVSTAVSKSVTGTFTAGQSIFYRVRAWNSNGPSGNSATQEVVITAAPVVLLPTVTNSATSGTVTWTSGPDWIPNNPVSASNATITFNGVLNGVLTANNDTASPFLLNSLVFANSGVGTNDITGGVLQLTNNGTTNPTITFINNTTYQRVSAPIQLDTNVTVSQSGSTASNSILAGVVSGVGGLTKSGAGYVYLTQTNNSFGGPVTIGNGTLVPENIGLAGQNSSLGTNGAITLGGGGLTGTLRWGSGSVTNEATDKTFALPGSIGGGTIDVRGTNSLLTLNGAIDTGTNASSRNLTLTGQGGATVNGLISGKAGLRVNGSSTRTVNLANANNNFGGPVTIDGNTGGAFYRVQVANIGNAGLNSPLGTNSTINIGTTNNAFNFLVWSNTVAETTDKTINLAGTVGGALIANKGPALLKFTAPVTATGVGAKTFYPDQDDANGVTEFAGEIPNSSAGATALNKNGAGTLILSAANTFTGGFTLKGGTLELRHAQGLATGNTLIFPNSGTGSGRVKVSYAGSGSDLGNLLVQAAATIDLGTDNTAQIRFGSATNWTADMILTIANSTGGGALYITNTTGVPLVQIKSVENPTYLADFTTDGKLIFVENSVTITDTTGTIDGLQAQIISTRAANADALIKIQLKSGTTYSVNTSPLVLDSNMCLTGEASSRIESANSSVSATSLVKIIGSKVAVNNLTLVGNNAPLYGIEAAGVNRVNVDQVTVSGTGKDGIYLQGAGSTVFNNEMTVTRCRASNILDASGIHIKDSTQAFCSDNLSQNNKTGFIIESSQHGTFYRNQAVSNTIGLSLQGADWSKIADNLIREGTTGISSDSTSDRNVFVGNILRNCSNGLSLNGTQNTSYSNSFGSGVVTPVESTGNNFLLSAEKVLLVSDAGYFHPPTASNPHSDSTIVIGKGRTDVATTASTLSEVQTAYDIARANNPNNVIVLRLTAPVITGDKTLDLESFTSVILDGQINLAEGVSAFKCLGSFESSSNTTNRKSYVSISGGTINGGNTTGRHGILLDRCSSILIEGVTLINFGDKNTRVAGSDVIKVGTCGNPVVISSCSIDGGASRGIWTISSTYVMVVGNTISNVNMDGIDLDSATFNSLVLRNTSKNNKRYGIFIEEGAQENVAIGNTCFSNEIGINLYSSYTSSVERQTWHNGLFMNSVDSNQKGIRFGAATPSSTSENFAFNNRISVNSIYGIDAQNAGENNYLSQNVFSGNTINLGLLNSAVLFDSPRVANSAPVIGAAGFTALENTTSTNPNAVAASDSESNLLTYLISSGPDAAKFQIDPVSGILTFLTAPDFENPADTGRDNIYNLTVQVSDGTEVVAKDVIVTVGDVVAENRAPTDIGLSLATIAENNASSAQVGVFSSTDSDVGNTFTYTLVAGAGAEDNTSFNIVNGNLVVLSVFDYETKNSYFIRVRTTDQGGSFFEEQFTISVTNVIDSPAEYKAGWLTANLLASDSDLNTDPKNVGYSLATAYAFGLSPSVRGGAPISLVSSTAGSVKIVYLQREGVSGVTYTVKSGTDLAVGLNGTVTPVPSAVQPSPGKSGYTQYEATYTSGGSRGFLRVQAVVP